MFTFEQGNCFDLMEKIPDHSIDLILTDPPYSITRNKWDTPIDLDVFWHNCRRVLKENGAALIFGSGLFSARLLLSNPKEYRYKWIWVKNASTGFLNAKKMPLKIFEEVNVFYRRLPTYNPQMRKTNMPSYTKKHGRPSTCYNAFRKNCISSQNDGTRYPNDVLNFPVVANGANARIHPTQKPVALLEYFIKTYSNEGDTVLDPFAGSCSCGHACLNTGRNFIGFEQNEEYYKQALVQLNKTGPLLN